MEWMKCLHQTLTVAGLLAAPLHPDPAAPCREQHHQHPGPPLQGPGLRGLVRVPPGHQGRQASRHQRVRVPGVRAPTLLPAQVHHPQCHR